MIVVDSVECRVEDRRILGPVSFVVSEGESVAVTGPSGSGKSTLLNCIAGLRKPDSGTVWVGDTPVSTLGRDAAAAFRMKSIGQVFQTADLLEELSVVENVMLPALFRRVDRRSARQQALNRLRSVRLADRADDTLDGLSGGELQRVSVARALVTPVSVLLADEPTASLDRDNAAEVTRLLFAAAGDAGVCVVVATHDPAVAGACDRRVGLEG